jgi:hypothetical protein
LAPTGKVEGATGAGGAADVQHRELTLAHFQPAGDVLDRVLVRIFGQAQ